MTTAKVHLRAEAKQMHHGVAVFRGDPMVTTPEEAADLVALRFASVVDHSVDEEALTTPPPPKPMSKKPTLQKKVVEPTKPGRYRRRDLRAEE